MKEKRRTVTHAGGNPAHKGSQPSESIRGPPAMGIALIKASPAAAREIMQAGSD